MTPEQLDAIENRANQAADHVAMLCTKEERWRMSVPPKDSDSDLMLMQVLEADVSQLVAEVRKLQGEVSKDERLVRYMTLVTPLGYQSALTVVQEMTKLLVAEEIAEGSVNYFKNVTAERKQP